MPKNYDELIRQQPLIFVCPICQHESKWRLLSTPKELMCPKHKDQPMTRQDQQPAPTPHANDAPAQNNPGHTLQMALF